MWFKNIFGNKKKSDPMKYLIVGLGNIGQEYQQTRHNIGFDVLDHLAMSKDFSFQTDRSVICLKPSTYMNRSGKAVRYWVQREKIQPMNLLVVVDDIHIELNRLRMRTKGNDGGHNGLRDIIQYFGKDFSRLRIGIGKDFQTGYQSDYVLGRWSEDEAEALQEILKYASKAILSFVSVGANRTMSQFNN
jgi:PTH1 family peptidyl-tRNA hydrolase